MKTAFRRVADGGERSDGDNFKQNAPAVASAMKQVVAATEPLSSTLRRVAPELTEHLPRGRAVVAFLRSLPVAPEEIYGEHGG